MHKTQLTQVLNLIRKAYAGANFAGQFDEATREKTRQYRHDNIAVHLQNAQELVMQEIARCDAKITKRRQTKKNREASARRPFRLPYKD